MLGDYDDDFVDSDGFEEALERSRQDRHSNAAGTSRSSNINTNSEPAWAQKQTLDRSLTSISIEISGVDQQIKDLQELRGTLVRKKKDIEKQLGDVQQTSTRVGPVDRKGKGKAVQGGIDYMKEMDWSDALKARMKNVFGIDNFRLCQQGVCNANMDGRDIVCVMPTGGGKSLTYQLPALLMAGCTFVISPLISLITDQILHLREAGVDAVMLTGGTSKSEKDNIRARLSAMASGKAVQEIKLCYVTPEMVAKNNAFKSLMEKLAHGGKLARIVIDEAHCVSHLGHDYRPDYQKLSILRQLLPGVPIMALSATCPKKVLLDILKVLRMKNTVDGNAAPTDGTVYFSAPLYRKNLHYQVLPKPASSSLFLEKMSEYILQNHKDDSGIVYCFSKKETEKVAHELFTYSRGQIKTGVYHADVKDAQKEELHIRWRKGEIKVVCATIAFGLGIDKGNVRFVLHHSISKSLDGFYQESGRAGRDGLDADCILYYRPQDTARLSALTVQEHQAQQKLHEILKFAQDLKECRKILFARYFSVSSDLSMASWTTDETDALARCGHCDNCTRPPESVDHRDVTVEAWQILKILEYVQRHDGRLTLNTLSDVARGAGGGGFEGGKGKGKKQAEKQSIDLDDVAGGKINLSKDDTETVIIVMLLSGYLQESFSQTAYNVNVYVVLGSQALRLSRLSRQALDNKQGPQIQCSLRKAIRKSKASDKPRKASKEVPHNDLDSGSEDISERPAAPKLRIAPKRKRPNPPDAVDSMRLSDDHVSDPIDEIDSRESDADSDVDWSTNLGRTYSRARKKPRQISITNHRPSKSTAVDDAEIIELSSD